ncbi:MAG: glutaredoxin family protein [Caldilineaceae bacterium]|nr:glutaredoxin family protein [Caldilineaceae bacterium]
MYVRLYSKPDCSLCDKLKADLVEYQRELGFTLEELNIEEDAAAFERYRYLIPVLDIEGGPLLYPPHTWEGVGAALRAAARKDAYDH